MKLSISVPEPLWKEAWAFHPELNPSRLVQTALEAMAHAERTFTLGERPAEVDEAFAARAIDSSNRRMSASSVATPRPLNPRPMSTGGSLNPSPVTISTCSSGRMGCCRT